MRVIFSMFLVIAVMTGGSSSTFAKDKKAAAQAELAPEISLDELKKVVATKTATIVDVNSPKSYAAGHIPGAIHFASLGDKFATALPQDKSALIVAYCGGPMCTAWQDAAKKAKALGYTNVKHYKGGIKTWKESGNKTEAAKS